MIGIRGRNQINIRPLEMGLIAIEEVDGDEDPTIIVFHHEDAEALANALLAAAKPFRKVAG